jgi:hypothetical protein
MKNNTDKVEKLDEFQIAKLILAFDWNTDKVLEYAKQNSFPPPSESDLFWGGFVAAGAARAGFGVP